MRSAVHAGPVPANLLLVGLTGSHAYGLATEASDVDIRGVFAAPTRDVLGLDGPQKLVELADADTNFEEVQRFLELCLACNPERLEMLAFARGNIRFYKDMSGAMEPAVVDGVTFDHRPSATRKVALVNDFGAQLVGMQDQFLYRGGIVGRYGGFARGQRRKLEASGTTGKPAAHLIRLMLTAIHALQKGRIACDVSLHRDDLLAIRRGEWPLAEVLAWHDRLEQELQLAVAETSLPDDNQEGREAANELLFKIRMYYLTWQAS